MSGRPLPYLPRWRNAVRDSDLDSTSKLVALVLSTFMDSNGRCWPSRERIARAASLSVRSVAIAMLRIEASGLLDVNHSKGRTANRYQAVIAQPGATFPVDRALDARFNQASDGPNRAPRSPESVEIERKRGRTASLEARPRICPECAISLPKTTSLDDHLRNVHHLERAAA